MKLTIHSPDEFVAAIPHLLGFKPEESLVLLPIRGDLPVARVDFPTTPRACEAVWKSVHVPFMRHAQPGASVGIACLTADRQYANVVGHDFAARLHRIDIDTQVMLWANDTHWADLHTGESGSLTQSARERFAATTVLDGHRLPAPSRESLGASLIGDREPIMKLLPETRAVARLSTPRVEAAFALNQLRRFQADGIRLTDEAATRLLVALESISIRDCLCDDMTTANAASHTTLWTDLTRRAPDDVRAAPASLLAVASWLSGDGASAWCALDQVPHDKPYPLANLIAAALQTGIHPRDWDTARATGTGHRIDRSTGILPPRPTTQPNPAHRI